MKSVHIHGWSDLKQFGINSLTGESCAFSMRLLCDLSEEGTDLMSEFFGLPRNDASLCFAPPWNSRVGDDPSIASIMLPKGIFDDLCRFALLAVSKVDVVIKQPDGSWCGYSELTNDVETMLETLVRKDGWLRFTNPHRAGTDGSRNVHAFTGRSS